MQLFVYPLQLQAAIFPGSYGKSSKGVLCRTKLQSFIAAYCNLQRRVRASQGVNFVLRTWIKRPTKPLQFWNYQKTSFAPKERKENAANLWGWQSRKLAGNYYYTTPETANVWKESQMCTTYYLQYSTTKSHRKCNPFPMKTSEGKIIHFGTRIWKSIELKRSKNVFQTKKKHPTPPKVQTL